MIFYLGTPDPSWLRRSDVPLFVSCRRLARYKTLPRARGPWKMDSAGFTEILKNGRYEIAPASYVSLVRRCVEYTGNLEHAAIQDWMCEDVMLKRTGLTIEDHQRKTVESYSELRYLAPELPWLPVLQGQSLSDYLHHLEMYWTWGDDDLTALPLVGVGSVCRRQSTIEIKNLLIALHARGVRIHAFGLKLAGIENSADYIESSDSQAWSFEARKKDIKLESCTHKGKRCSFCLEYALSYRERVLESIAGKRFQSASLF